MNMSRERLVISICENVKAKSSEQVSKVNKLLSDVVFEMQLQYRHEILISELSETNIANITQEVIRRYRHGEYE